MKKEWKEKQKVKVKKKMYGKKDSIPSSVWLLSVGKKKIEFKEYPAKKSVKKPKKK